MFKRTKGYYNSDYTIQDFYEWYCATASGPISKDLFKKVFKKFIERMMIEIIYNSAEMDMGNSLGILRIRDKEYKIELNEEGRVDKKKLIPNWGKTLKKWKVLYKDTDPNEWHNIKNKPIIYHENEHSDQTLKQWFWDRSAVELKNGHHYKFNATRYWDRLLAKVNKESNVSYYR